MTESQRRAAHERALDLATGAFRTDVLAGLCALELPDAVSEGARLLDELAQLLSTPAFGLKLLLNAGCALGVFVRRADRYALAPGTNALLGESAPACLRDALLQAAGESLRAQAIVSAVHRGAGMPDAVPPTLDGIAAALGAFASDIAPLIDASDGTRLLDLTDAGGGLALALLSRNHALRATVIAAPNTLEQARRAAVDAGFADRVQVLTPLDARTPIGNGYDAVLVGRTLRAADDVLAARILEGCRRRASARCALVVVDAMLDDDATEPAFGALLALEMWLRASPGRVRTRREVAALLAAAGFGQPRDVRRIPPSVHSLVWGTT